MVRYILSSVGESVKLDRRCPHCGCPNGRIHSAVRRRRVSDPKADAVPQRRMRCPRCGLTWTVRANGVSVGAEELRTDEHSVYAGIVPEAQHRLCLTHWRKSKGKRAWDLLQQAQREGRTLEVASMQKLLELLRQRPRPPTVPGEVERLVKRYINAHRGLPGKVNRLLQHVERTWAKVSDDPADPTNNATERVIGLTFKIRSKTMRGFKSQSKVLAHPYLASLLRGEGGICDLRKVI